tara:strand:+ start:311 stop:592 length:282 start_codon:yes stop_codon:yes gene_type:complete
MGWADWMVVQPPLEIELQLEKEARAIIQDDDHEQIAQLCATLSKQNWYQQQLIKQCVGKIGELEAQLVCLEEVKDRRETIWQKIKNQLHSVSE